MAANRVAAINPPSDNTDPIRNSVSTPEATRTCKTQQSSPQNESRYGISPPPSSPSLSLFLPFLPFLLSLFLPFLPFIPFLPFPFLSFSLFSFLPCSLSSFSLFPFSFSFPSFFSLFPFQYRPHIVDTETIADAIFADEVSETSRRRSFKGEHD